MLMWNTRLISSSTISSSNTITATAIADERFRRLLNTNQAGCTVVCFAVAGDEAAEDHQGEGQSELDAPCG